MSAPTPLFFTPQATSAEIISDGAVAAGAQVFNTTTGQLQFTNDGSTFEAAASSSDLANYLPLTGGNLTGPLDMGAYDITSVATLGTANIQMVGGNINCDAQQINNVGDPVVSTDAATKNYVDTVATVNVIFVTGTSITMTDTSMTNRYILQNSATCTLTLPTTIAAGHTFEIIGGGTAGWNIAQNVGQSVQLGNQVTTSGVAGSLQSTFFSDSLILSCTANDTNLTGYGVQGNISIF